MGFFAYKNTSKYKFNISLYLLVLLILIAIKRLYYEFFVNSYYFNQVFIVKAINQGYNKSTIYFDIKVV